MKNNTLRFWKMGVLLLVVSVFTACATVLIYRTLLPETELLATPTRPIIPFQQTLDMNEFENRWKFYQLTGLAFPSSVQWESAHITYNPIPQHIFEGSARMTRSDFDAVFANVSFREWGDHIGSPDHPYQGTADFPRSNSNLRVGYDRYFETNKADNPETLVRILFLELRAKHYNNDSPFTPEIVRKLLLGQCFVPIP